jgi:hypothetical protein
MFSISEISRIYSLCSLKKHWIVTFHIYTIQKYICFTRYVVFQKPYPQKITDLSQVTEKEHPVRTWSRNINLCAMWKALVVVPYEAMYHTLSRPVPFIWQCVLRYHGQCLLPGNVSYGTMTSAFHMAMCHTVPRPEPCERRWSWYRMTHCKVKDIGRGIVWHIAMWNTLVVLPYGGFDP